MASESDAYEALKNVAVTIAIQWKAYVEQGLPEEVATDLSKHYIDVMFKMSSEKSNLNDALLKMLKGSAPDKQS
jgi:hypothetical protein